jgi:hypothetical protein
MEKNSADSSNIWRVLTVVLAVVLIAAGVAWFSGVFRSPQAPPRANSIMVIAPYRHAGTWVFDDSQVGLHKEPFVAGIPEMIDDMVKNIPDAHNGFRLLFSAQEFPGWTHKLIWRRGETAGNWYYSPQFDKEGWLCPGFFKYYEEAPKEIYVKAEAR